MPVTHWQCRRLPMSNVTVTVKVTVLSRKSRQSSRRVDKFARLAVYCDKRQESLYTHDHRSQWRPAAPGPLGARWITRIQAHWRVAAASGPSRTFTYNALLMSPPEPAADSAVFKFSVVAELQESSLTRSFTTTPQGLCQPYVREQPVYYNTSRFMSTICRAMAAKRPPA